MRDGDDAQESTEGLTADGAAGAGGAVHAVGGNLPGAVIRPVINSRGPRCLSELSAWFMMTENNNALSFCSLAEPISFGLGY